jgi:hypothetical protein
MRRLGLYEVMLGIESIQPDVLSRYEKQQSRGKFHPNKGTQGMFLKKENLIR